MTNLRVFSTIPKILLSNKEYTLVRNSERLESYVLNDASCNPNRPVEDSDALHGKDSFGCCSEGFTAVVAAIARSALPTITEANVGGRQNCPGIGRAKLTH